MKPSLTLIRAISAEFLRRKYKSTVIMLGAIAVVVLAVAVYLTTLSAWWWLLLVPLVSAVIIGVVVLVGAGFVVSMLKPNETPMQYKAVNAFVDKLERVQETIQTPMFVMVFQIARDMVKPRIPTYLQTITKDGTTLHTDFIKLQKDFNAPE